MPKFFTRYTPPPAVSEENNSPTMTQQHYKDECDLNQILARHRVEGELNAMQLRQLLAQSAMGADSARIPRFEDVSDLPDLSYIKKSFIAASRAFAHLPIQARVAFGNNPEAFYQAMTDKKQHEKVRDLGLGFLLADSKNESVLGAEQSAQELS